MAYSAVVLTVSEAAWWPPGRAWSCLALCHLQYCVGVNLCGGVCIGLTRKVHHLAHLNVTLPWERGRCEFAHGGVN
eukprot:1124743-Pelagomonas_calceolata.AAC.6